MKMENEGLDVIMKELKKKKSTFADLRLIFSCFIKYIKTNGSAL